MPVFRLDRECKSIHISQIARSTHFRAFKSPLREREKNPRRTSRRFKRSRRSIPRVCPPFFYTRKAAAFISFLESVAEREREKNRLQRRRSNCHVYCYCRRRHSHLETFSYINREAFLQLTIHATSELFFLHSSSPSREWARFSSREMRLSDCRKKSVLCGSSDAFIALVYMRTRSPPPIERSLRMQLFF